MNNKEFFGPQEPTWDSIKRTGRASPNHSNYGNSDFGYRSKAAREAQSATDHFKKAGVMAIGGSGLKRETLLNSVGLLSKHQKAAAKGGGFMNKAQRALIPGGAAVGAFMTLNDGGNVVDFVGDFVLPEIGLFTGWHVGKNAGFGAGKALGFGGRGVLAMGATAGVAAAATGLALGIGAGMLAKEAGDSDSFLNRTAENLMHADFDLSLNETSNTLTHKQRALNKLSKSALNDRGTLLGNEAQVIAGIL